MSEYGDYGYDPYNEEPRKKPRRQRLFGARAKRSEGDPYGDNDWGGTLSYADSTVYDEYGYIPPKRRSLISRIAKPAAASALALSLLAGTGLGLNRAFSDDETTVTPTSISTSTPESSWTPEPTSTATSTPEPTATSTPSPTPTEVPPTPTPEPSPTPSPTPTEVVRTPEAPTDLIPRDVLRDTYNTQIIDVSGENFVTLDFREGAVEHSGLLQMMKESDNTLTIVLIDGPYVNPAYITQEQIDQNPKILGVLQESFDRIVASEKENYETGEQKILDQNEYNERLLDLQNKLDKKEIPQDQFNVEKQYLDFQFSKLLGTMPDEEWVSAAGLQFDRDREDLILNNKDKYIFQAVRPRESLVFQSGNVRWDIDFSEIDQNRIPNPEYSYPSPSDLRFNAEEKVYPLNNLTAGSVMRHEMEHAEGIHNEYDPDLNTYEDIAEASQLYLNGDDGAYYITFRTPKGWQITQQENTEENPNEPVYA